MGILRYYFVPSKYISILPNIFRSLEIHFVLSKSASFPPNTLPPVEIPIVSPSKLASKLAGTVLRNAEELKKNLSIFSLGGGGGGLADPHRVSLVSVRSVRQGVGLAVYCRSVSQGVDLAVYCRSVSQGVDLAVYCRSVSQGVDLAVYCQNVSSQGVGETVQQQNHISPDGQM